MKRISPHLSLEERKLIRKRLNLGMSCSEISKSLGRGKNTVVREVRINGGREKYHPIDAHEAVKRRHFEGREKLSEINKKSMTKVKSMYEIINERLDSIEMIIKILNKKIKDLDKKNEKD